VVVSGLWVLAHSQPALRLRTSVPELLPRLREHGIQHLRNKLLFGLGQLLDGGDLLLQPRSWPAFAASTIGDCLPHQFIERQRQQLREPSFAVDERLLSDAKSIGQPPLREAVCLAGVGDTFAEFPEKPFIRGVHG
ncbi:hypothetical protein, partial [Burkholderia ubonensis]|uniref:hypothetical protein n=1 Tax=Burkholderia ubonensis TaxID=101571 RepID=UPI0012F9C378